MTSVSFTRSGGPPAFATAATSRKYLAPMSGVSMTRTRAVVAARIAEGVHGASRRRHPVARPELARLVVDRIAEDALEHVDALLVVGMAVWRRHGGAGRHRHLEDPEPAFLRTVDADNESRSARP